MILNRINNATFTENGNNSQMNVTAPLKTASKRRAVKENRNIQGECKC